jgi:hypothetical protein
MPQTIVLNSSNIVANSSNSVFKYDFPQGGVNFKDDYISIQQISIYNSVFNITAINNNNSFSYVWIDGNTTYPVTLPDSYLSLAEINAYLQSVMIANKHYLLTSTGQYVYLLNIQVNPSRYAYQINSFYISTAIATTNSWTLPAGATWVLPTNPILPEFIVPATRFANLIGFSAGAYPNATISGTPPAQTQTTPAVNPPYSALSATSFSAISTSAPQIIVQPSYLCNCSLVSNPLANPSQTIYSLTPFGVGFGELYTNALSEYSYNKIADGNYNQFTFSFVDSLGRAISFQDPNTLILLLIKNKKELLF